MPSAKKLSVSFDNGHVYLWHDGKKADSWGRPPWIVTASPKFDEQRMNGQMFLVLVDHRGDLPARFDQVLEAFAEARDRTCIGLMCKFINEVYPEGETTRAFNTQDFLRQVIHNQSPDGYSVSQLVVTGRETYQAAVSAQYTNQLKSMRNAIFGIFTKTYREPAPGGQPAIVPE